MQGTERSVFAHRNLGGNYQPHLLPHPQEAQGGMGWPFKCLALCWCSRHSINIMFKQPGFEFISKGFPGY